MLTLAPILFLIFSSLLINLLHGFERGRGYAWMAALLSAIIAWASVLFLGSWQPDVLAIPQWRPYLTETIDTIIFRWDEIAWPYAFAMVSLGLAVIFTAPVRFHQNSNPRAWAANLAFTGLGLTAILAATPLGLILSWTMLDLADLGYVLRFIPDWRDRREAVTGFAARLIGTSLLLAAVVAARAEGGGWLFEDIQPAQGLLVLGAVVFRLGILPLNLGYVHQLPLQHGVTNTLRIAGIISGLIVLARIPDQLFSNAVSPFLITLMGIACLYGALVWLVSKDEITGRPYWFLTLSGLAILSTMLGFGQSSIVWGLSLVISGGALFLFSFRSRRLLVIPILGLVGFSSIPFTPGSEGWLPFSNSASGIIFLILVQALIMIGYIRHAVRPGAPIGYLEGWGKVLYTIGLVILLLSGWLPAIFEQPSGLSVGIWWAASIVLILVALGCWLGWRRVPQEDADSDRAGWLFMLVSRAGEGIREFLLFGWLFKILGSLFSGLQRLVLITTDLLEGQGGVLWALLLLALLLTILGAGGG